MNQLRKLRKAMERDGVTEGMQQRMLANSHYAGAKWPEQQRILLRDNRVMVGSKERAERLRAWATLRDLSAEVRRIHMSSLGWRVEVVRP